MRAVPMYRVWDPATQNEECAVGRFEYGCFNVTAAAELHARYQYSVRAGESPGSHPPQLRVRDLETERVFDVDITVRWRAEFTGRDPRPVAELAQPATPAR